MRAVRDFVPRHKFPRSNKVITFVVGLDDRGSSPGWSEFFSLPQRQDLISGPPSLLLGGYRGSFLGDEATEPRS